MVLGLGVVRLCLRRCTKQKRCGRRLNSHERRGGAGEKGREGYTFFLVVFLAAAGFLAAVFFFATVFLAAFGFFAIVFFTGLFFCAASAAAGWWGSVQGCRLTGRAEGRLLSRATVSEQTWRGGGELRFV